MNDNEILAVEEAAARLASSSPDSGNPTDLLAAVAAALSHGKPIRDVAAAAHLTALEVLDAADAATYPGPARPPRETRR